MSHGKILVGVLAVVLALAMVVPAMAGPTVEAGGEWAQAEFTWNTETANGTLAHTMWVSFGTYMDLEGTTQSFVYVEISTVGPQGSYWDYGAVDLDTGEFWLDNRLTSAFGGPVTVPLTGGLWTEEGWATGYPRESSVEIEVNWEAAGPLQRGQGVESSKEPEWFYRIRSVHMWREATASVVSLRWDDNHWGEPVSLPGDGIGSMAWEKTKGVNMAR